MTGRPKSCIECGSTNITMIDTDEYYCIKCAHQWIQKKGKKPVEIQKPQIAEKVKDDDNLPPPPPPEPEQTFDIKDSTDDLVRIAVVPKAMKDYMESPEGKQFQQRIEVVVGYKLTFVTPSEIFGE